jgi:peroxiredoxin
MCRSDFTAALPRLGVERRRWLRDALASVHPGHAWTQSSTRPGREMVCVLTDDVYTLPPNLPVPEDDGAADHLLGAMLPQLTLESSQGPVSLRELAGERLVLYVYPRAGRPGRRPPTGWDDIPGARGCTPQSCAFRDRAAELASLGARLAGLSAQTLDDQVEFAERNGIAYPVIADPERRLGAALGLPTFDVDGMTLYKRITLVVEACAIARVFYPVFPPDANAAEVVAWLTARP